MVRLKQIYLMFLVAFLLSGCFEKPLPDNVVATVNNKAITLHTVQSLQEIEFTDFNYQGKPSLEKLRKQYGATLATIILYEIVLQHLESTGYKIEDTQVEAYEKKLLAEFPPDEFEKYITENAINLEVWRILLRYQLALDLFSDMILRTAYVPSVEEVQKYYADNRKKFKLSETYTLQVGMSEQKESLENINNLQELLNSKSDFTRYSITLKPNALPKDTQKAILDLNEQDCTKIFEVDEMFSRICLIRKNDAEDVSISKAYAYIERQLIEERLDGLLHTWLEQNAKDFDVRVSTHLIKEII